MNGNRHARLFGNSRKDGDGLLVTVHGFFQSGDSHDGYAPVVVVEHENGDVEEHEPSRIRFVE